MGIITRKAAPTAVPLSSISTSPHYQLNSLTNFTVQTYGVSNATAINNIKSALDSHQPVVFSFFMNSNGWSGFLQFLGQ